MTFAQRCLRELRLVARELLGLNGSQDGLLAAPER
jgi:hypothetical protein